MNTGFISAKILILKNELEHYYVQHKQSETKKVIVYFKPKQISQVWEPQSLRHPVCVHDVIVWAVLLFVNSARCTQLLYKLKLISSL